MAQAGTVMVWLQRLASPRWSVAFFLLAALAALAVMYGWAGGTLAMLVPLGLLAVNLLASIIVHRRFRSDVPLLVFHLALVALVVLFLIARLTYLEGLVTVMKGASFDGALQWKEHGPLHDLSGLKEAQFTNLGFSDLYRDEEGRFATRNRVRWQAESGIAESEIGTDLPLVAGHYRIYVSTHRGLAAIFEWRPDSGVPQHGAVQFAVQRDGFSDGSSWRLPTGQEVWATLDIPEMPNRGAGQRLDDLGAPHLAHSLVLKAGDARHVLKPGDVIPLAGGHLAYQQLESWIGYRVLYDPTRPWLLATIALAVGSLIWFYTRTVFLRPRRD